MHQAGAVWLDVLERAWISNRMDIARLDLEAKKKEQNRSLWMKEPQFNKNKGSEK